MLSKFIRIFLGLIIITIANAYSIEPVTMSGSAADYAGNRIDIYYEHDFISKEKVLLGSIEVNKDGSFNLQFDIDKTVLGQANFDTYHALIYFEPGKKYQLVFPPKKALTEAQKRNPFFQASEIWFGLDNPNQNDLNVLIQEYESFYYQLENTYFRQIFVNRSYSTADIFKQRLDTKFRVTDNSFFEAHKKYRKGNIDFALNQGKTEKFLDDYFIREAPYYNLPAYQNLFEQVFSDYFNHIGNASYTQDIKSYLRQKNLDGIEILFCDKLNFSKEFAHLLILSSLKDAYYSNQYNQADVLDLLKKITVSDWTRQEKTIAEKIVNKLTFLKPGTYPPDITLTDLNGNPIKFDDYNGKLIYLHFTDAKNPVCRQHLEALELIAEKYSNDLIIIHVLTENNAANGYYPWHGIYAKTNDKIDELYKVKTYPTSYLIDREGKLAWSPAPNPIDGLNSRLSQWFRSERIQKQQDK